jgi:hypothetical protein
VALTRARTDIDILEHVAEGIHVDSEWLLAHESPVTSGRASMKAPSSPNAPHAEGDSES